MLSAANDYHQPYNNIAKTSPNHYVNPMLFFLYMCGVMLTLTLISNIFCLIFLIRCGVCVTCMRGSAMRSTEGL